MKAPTAKQYIIAALMAVLAAAVVVTAFFIVLSPARILISVAGAGSHMTAGNRSVELALTLSVNNTSTRARVEYESIYIDVGNSTTGVTITANTTAVAMPLLQPKLNETRIHATVSLPLKDVGPAWLLDFTGNAFAVTVTALARFKVGFAKTRLYDIEVKCASVSFFFPGAAQVTGGVPPAPLPVLCV
jgi:hypothetical protein